MEIADVFIVTSPMNGPYWTHERDLWLMKHFRIGRGLIVHTNCKFVVSGDMFVHDSEDHIRAWKEHNKGVALLFDRHYNRSAKVTHRLSGWDELLRLVLDVG